MNWFNKILPVGSRSLLFGVHQFLWHPVTVALAWRRLHKKWPSLGECVCIFVHDWGYWGCNDMDGPEGKRHPELGARVAARWVGRLNWLKMWSCLPLVFAFTKVGRRSVKGMLKEGAYKFYFGQIRGGIGQRTTVVAVAAYYLVRYHSRSLAKSENAPVSPLCAPDKLSVIFDPHLFYMLRAWISGEGREFRQNAVKKIGLQSLSHWLYWYRNSIRKQYEKTPADPRPLSDL